MTKTVVLTPSSVDLPRDITLDAFSTALEQAATAWSYPAIACTSLRIVAGTPQRQRLAVRDSLNLVVFRGTRWCHNERCGKDSTFPLRAVAMTTVFPNEAPLGRVEEADIELNAAHFAWEAGGADDKPVAPLRAVLVHELGHVLGLRDDAPHADGAMALVGPLAPSPEETRQVCEAFPR